MIATKQLTVFAVALLYAGQMFCQVPPGTALPKRLDNVGNSWTFSLTTDGYIIPNETDYASPVFSADRSWLHLEARYNDENLRTGSLWVGYNFGAGKEFVLNFTPMIGGIFGRTTGIAPGCEASLTYKKVQLSVSNEYVFDTAHKSGNYYYTWPQLTYSASNWLRVGLMAERTRDFQTSLSVQRGFLVGISRTKWESTVYIFNAGFTNPTVVLELGLNF